MGAVQIITDSTCALPCDMDAGRRATLRIVRPTVQIGTESWPEGDLSLDEFYARVAAGEIARSSHPAPAEFLSAYSAALQDGPPLAILLSGALSGTYHTGQVVAREIGDGQISLFDSGYFSSALGFMVDEASRMAHEGSSREQIIEQLTWRRANTALFFTINTLDFLRRSGRASTLQATVATMLDIKPVLSVQEGTLVVVARVRSRHKSLDEVVARTAKAALAWGQPVWASAMHGAAPTEAATILDALAHRVPLARRFVCEIPAAVALHGGPGVVGLTVTPAERG